MKIVTHANDYEYILVSLIVSTHEFDCKYLRVHLQVPPNILKFNALEFCLMCGKCITLVCSLTLAFDTHV